MVRDVKIDGLFSLKYDGLLPEYNEENVRMFLKNAINAHRKKTGYPIYLDWMMPTRVCKDDRCEFYKEVL